MEMIKLPVLLTITSDDYQWRLPVPNYVKESPIQITQSGKYKLSTSVKSLSNQL